MCRWYHHLRGAAQASVLVKKLACAASMAKHVQSVTGFWQAVMGMSDQ